MYNNWADLEKACLQCQKCGLCSGRHNVVFGVGNRRSKVMFVGEGPGENEDLQGEPFVGRGGAGGPPAAGGRAAGGAGILH